MRYVAAYLLAVLGGNDKPTDKDIKKILSSVGIDADTDSINKVIAELKGKAIEDVIKAGQTKLASVPSGAPAPAAAAPAAAPAADAKGAPAKGAAAPPPKKEEKEEEEDMGFGLFD